MGLHLISCPAVTTQDADPFELSVSCVGVVPCLAPAEFCTTSPHRRYQNIFCEWSSSPLNVLQGCEAVGYNVMFLALSILYFCTTSRQTTVVKWRRRILRRGCGTCHHQRQSYNKKVVIYQLFYPTKKKNDKNTVVFETELRLMGKMR